MTASRLVIKTPSLRAKFLNMLSVSQEPQVKAAADVHQMLAIAKIDHAAEAEVVAEEGSPAREAAVEVL